MTPQQTEDAQNWNRHGITLAQQGQHQEAERCFRYAMQLWPGYGDVYNNLGIVLMFQGKFVEAVATYQQALQLQGEDAGVYNNLGYTLYQQGKMADAAACCQRALELKPDFAEAHNNLGIALQGLGRIEEAEARYREAGRLKPDLSDACNNLANILRQRLRWEEAAEWYRRALASRPNFVAALSGLGAMLLQLGKEDEGLAYCRQAAALQPESAESFVSMADALWRLGQLEEAAQWAEAAVRSRPDMVSSHTTLAAVCLAQGKIAEAQGHFDRALGMEPDNADAHFRAAQAWLMAGELERGFREFEWRWKCPWFVLRPFPRPVWDGSPLAGRSILLLAEQGIGDTLQFIRFAPQVKQQGGTVLVACPKNVVSLLSRCAGVDFVGAHEDAFQQPDVVATLFSLPAKLGATMATIPTQVPYLFTDPALVDHWREQIGRSDRFKVGIAWQGSIDNPINRQRSAPLEAFLPLAQVEGVELVSLQVGPGIEELGALAGRASILDIGSRLQTFDDTAAVMQNLDLIVTVETAVAHLAGGLGLSVWVALPFAPDWRWMLDRDDSPWYPTARLFRQPRWGRWDEVFSQIAVELGGMLSRPK